MTKIKLNNVDLAWLRMEHQTNPMMITVALQFIGRVDYDRLSYDHKGFPFTVPALSAAHRQAGTNFQPAVLGR